MISHDATGSGPAVLLVHAGVADRRMWEPQLSALGARHRVVRVDLHGFGDSPLPPEPYDHVDDLVAVLDRSGVDRAAVVRPRDQSSGARAGSRDGAACVRAADRAAGR